MSRVQFHEVLTVIKANDVFSPKQTPVEYQLSIALSRFGEYGTASSFLKKASRFGVGEGTVTLFTARVFKALTDLKSAIIVWPTPEERKKICDSMENSLPDCIAYMDGTHINLEEAPINDPESYFTRKQRYAIQLQGIVDNDRKFRNVVVRWPGSVHDSRVYSNCKISSNSMEYLSNNEWIAADSAYPLSETVITPFRRNTKDLSEVNRVTFQKQFSKYRVKVEHAFGILKETFSSLKELRIRVDAQNGHRRACEWIMACIILYNIIKPEPDEGFTFTEEDDSPAPRHPSQHQRPGEAKRMKLVQWVIKNIR